MFRNYVKGVKRHFMRVSMLRTLRGDGKYEEREMGMTIECLKYFENERRKEKRWEKFRDFERELRVVTALLGGLEEAEC